MLYCMPDHSNPNKIHEGWFITRDYFWVKVFRKFLTINKIFQDFCLSILNATDVINQTLWRVSRKQFVILDHSSYTENDFETSHIFIPDVTSALPLRAFNTTKHDPCQCFLIDFSKRSPIRNESIERDAWRKKKTIIVWIKLTITNNRLISTSNSIYFSSINHETIISTKFNIVKLKLNHWKSYDNGCSFFNIYYFDQSRISIIIFFIFDDSHTFLFL